VEVEVVAEGHSVLTVIVRLLGRGSG